MAALDEQTYDGLDHLGTYDNISSTSLIMSTLLSFPTEITILIFKFSCNSSPLYLLPTVPTHDAAFQKRRVVEEGQEIAISQVCRTWRTIIIHGCPEIWTSINIFHPKYTPAGCKDRLLTYLERSQSQCLDLWVHLTEDFMEPLFDVLRSPNHNTQWRQISFSITGQCNDAVSILRMTQACEAILTFPVVDYPNLRAFQLCRPQTDVTFDMDTQMKTIPHLTSLRVHLTPSLEDFVARQRSLTVLHLDRRHPWSVGPSWSIISRLVADCPNLTALTIGQSLRALHIPHNQHDGDRVKAPKLRYLRCADFDVARNIWMYWRAPRLKLLVFKEVDIKFSGEIESSPFPTLGKLVFLDCRILSGGHIKYIASHTQSISQLVVSDSRTKIGQLAHVTPEDPGDLSLLTSFADLWPSERASLIHVLRMDPGKVGKLDWLPRNILRAIDFLPQRKMILNVGWKLRIDAGFAREWEARNPTQWMSLQAQELFEPLPVRDDFPCAAAGDADFRWTYEAGFAAY